MAKLSKAAVKAIEAAVDMLFERAKGRLLHPDPTKRYSWAGKALSFSYNPLLTLTGLYEAASKEEGVRPNLDTLAGLLKIAGTYLDSVKESTKARVVQQTQAFLSDASKVGVQTDLKTVLGGQLSELWGKVHTDVKRIVETESTITRNVSIHDAIGRYSAMQGIGDPTVFFVTVRDNSRCKECTRLHVQPDLITPKVWKQSQLGAGYHKRGDPNPKVGGLHPHCRCVLTVLNPGFGFTKGGMVTWKHAGYDEYAHQNP